MPDLRALQSAASEAARLAGAELLARWTGVRTVEFKHETDLVTDADTAAEQRIVDFLGQRFPGHAILAEERGSQAGESEHRWIIDPLDGTTNYAHRVPHFCVSIAVEDSQGVAAAAVFDPVRDELFTATRGEGAFLNGEQMHVSSEASLRRSLLATGFPYNLWDQPDRPLKLFDTFIRKAQGIRRAGSAALDLSYVASGRYDGFFEFCLKPWDVAAGSLLVREAGGTVSDPQGAPLDFAVCDVMATNGALHEEMTCLSRKALTSIP
ncbi:MAG: inositol monophosphatase [Deltaproteobacteria bacterium]|nr:inositol monophosphatase [Deltaproteobacteria bacterium]